MLRILLIPAALSCTLFAATPLIGQTGEAPSSPDDARRWEFLVSGGSIIPTGAQKRAIERGGATTARLSFIAHPALAVTTTVGWARSRDITSPEEPRLDLFTYDVGAELRGPRWDVGSAMTFRPFAGLGGGARSYRHRGGDVKTTHNPAAFFGVGGEFGMGRVRLRLEARDYVSGFTPSDGGARDTRNDLVTMLGLHIDFR